MTSSSSFVFSYSDEAYSSDILYIINTTWSGLTSTPALRAQSSASNGPNDVANKSNVNNTRGPLQIMRIVTFEIEKCQELQIYSAQIKAYFTDKTSYIF